MKKPYISIVIPVYNEQEVLGTLYNRLIPVMDNLNKPFEIVFTDDGSKDRSEEILKSFHQKRPNEIRVIHFNGNFGQHMAIMAGLEKSTGEIVITMDADLQNPPEDIPKLVAAIEAGHDVVGGYRENRKDLWWRKFFSRTHSMIRSKMIPKIVMKDPGCMLRAYKRNIVDLMIASDEANTFIPALALSFAANPTDIAVGHEERSAGESKYNFYKLIRYNFDLITNFSLVPLHIFTMLGIVISSLSGLYVIYLLILRLVASSAVQGESILFAILFLLVGVCLLGVGILGEYIGRIYQEVRQRPRFVIREMLEK